MALASATYNATPPTLASCNNNYRDWKNLIDHWTSLSGLDPSHRASAIMLTLSGKALNAALQLPSDTLKKADGVDKLLERLDSLFLKDTLSEKFRALEAFEIYKRPASTSIRDFLIEFDNRHYKVKEFGVIVSDDLLGFRLLKAANLNSDKEELIKATVSELTFNEVKSKMKQIFSDDTNVPSNSQTSTQSLQQETFHTNCSDQVYDSSETYSNPSSDEETFYTNNRFHQRSRKKVSFGKPQRHYSDRSSMNKNWRSSHSSNSHDKNWRSSHDNNHDKRSILKNSRNPLDRFGKQTRCDLCESINHWADNCPDRPNHDKDKPNHDKDTYLVHELLLFTMTDTSDRTSVDSGDPCEHEIILHTNSDTPVQMKALVAETWNSGLLDCGASRTVTGDYWFNEYVETLSDDDKSAVSLYDCSNFYRFGDGARVRAKQTAKFPAYIGGNRVFIVSDIVEKDLPLLLSKAFMKRAKVILDMDEDTLTLKPTGEIIKLHTTHSGHYILPLTRPAQLISNLKDSDKIILTNINDLSDLEIAQKLHRQFAHPTKEKLHQLVKHAGNPWSNNIDLLKAIDSVSSSCQTCQRFQRASPRPIVGLPMATKFLETVALDIKFYDTKPILHLIDLCTRLSAAAVMPNKQPETVVRTIMQIWVSVYGTTEKFLVDNGGEFANESFANMAAKLGITIKTLPGVMVLLKDTIRPWAI